MKRILPGIDSIQQHKQQFYDDPDLYRPEHCPHCGMGGLHHHGTYERNTPRGEGLAFTLGPVPIPRFYCPECHKSCSRLPACLSPRRHYGWVCQQVVLAYLVAGGSMRGAARRWWPTHRTISRWWSRLEERFISYRFHLSSRIPFLGLHDSLASFWSACFKQMSLSDAMILLDHEELCVP